MPATINVKVLGAGCSKCKALEAKIRSLAETHQLNIDIQKVTDLQEIMNYGVMMTPGLVIEGTLRSVGTVPSDKKLLEWLSGAE